jgi:hypothetical protein
VGKGRLEASEKLLEKGLKNELELKDVVVGYEIAQKRGTVSKLKYDTAGNGYAVSFYCQTAIKNNITRWMKFVISFFCQAVCNRRSSTILSKRYKIDNQRLAWGFDRIVLLRPLETVVQKSLVANQTERVAFFSGYLWNSWRERNKTSTDFTKANNALQKALTNNPNHGLNVTFSGQNVDIDGKKYTWHHHEDSQTMMLVETKIHDTFRHTGSNSIIEHNTKAFKDSPDDVVFFPSPEIDAFNYEDLK